MVGVTVWVIISSQVGMIAMVLVGCGGGALAVIAQQKLMTVGTIRKVAHPRSNPQ